MPFISSRKLTGRSLAGRGKSLISSLAVLAVTLALIATVIFWETEETVGLRIVGPETVVFDWSEQACAHQQMPDVPARAFRDKQGRVHLIAFNHLGHRMIGSNLDRLSLDCHSVISSHDRSDPADFDGREWLHSVYTDDGETIFALVHNEYQGHRFPRYCPSQEYRPCWYNAITLAISRDGGNTFRHSTPPDHLIAAIPEQYRPGKGPAGVFNPSNIIFRPEDGYYYALFRIIPYDEPARISLARTSDLSDTESWRAWDGRGFSTEFRNPYENTGKIRGGRLPAAIAPREISTMFTSLTYNTYLERYLLVGTAEGYEPDTGRDIVGVYYSLSKDLISWSPRRLIFEIHRPADWKEGDPDPIAFPSVLDPNSPSLSFETSGKTSYLFFTRFNFTDADHRNDRDLVRLTIEFD